MWPDRTETCAQLYTYHEARLTLENWYRHGVHAGGTAPTLVLLSSEVRFHLTAHVNSMNNRFPLLTKRPL